MWKVFCWSSACVPELHTGAFEPSVGQFIIIRKNFKFSVLLKLCHKQLTRSISGIPLKTLLHLSLFKLVSTFSNLFQNLEHHDIQ